ncbi:hypothetical protein EB796_006744 [Bugula neritina]|uniref:Ribosomal RNA-processing protein 8 n=1 Tax=Bugula neritina TaxID=10212 RepID=A0A7J7K9N2_BUGNE|nr:hypothetical protein EB796_006744 [Bugula neritina]
MLTLVSIAIHFVVADMGCGEAVLAASVPHKVYSFDMKALNERVTVADMANTPLQSGSVNMVVFCLSLMGTNITQFIQEAHRVLAAEGVLWISEVSSRFNRDMKTFSDGVESIGFKCTSCNTDMTHFATLTFKKTQSKAVTGKQRKSKVVDISLAPCLYKKR